MAEEIYVNDLRPDNDGSLALVPRIMSYEQLQEVFHVEVDRSLGWDVAPPGQPVFKLIGFSVRTGPSFFNRVFTVGGSPLPGVLICAWYPDHDVEPNWHPVPRYESPGFGDFTNVEGTWGLAVGGLVTDVDVGGPLVLFQSGAAPADTVALALKQDGEQTHHIKWVQG